MSYNAQIKILALIVTAMIAGCFIVLLGCDGEKDPVSSNHPPSTPEINTELGAPPDESINQSIDVTLYWFCYDPDNDAVSYDVYLGTQNPPPLVSQDQSATSYDPPADLEINTKYFWKVVAEDDEGATTSSSTWEFTTVTDQAPSIQLLEPVDQSTDWTVNPTLHWSGSDPEGDTVKYDVYLGTAATPPQVSSEQTDTFYTPPTLEFATGYYWKIVARDENANTASSTIWQFTTAGEPNQPPDEPEVPNPANFDQGQDINLTLSWACSDPENDPLTYDVYFGTNNIPPRVSSDQAGLSYTPPTLQHNTTYFWRILAKDDHGNTTSGPTWRFTTQGEGNNPPDPPQFVEPGDDANNVGLSQILRWTCTDPDGDPLTYDVHFGTIPTPSSVSSGQSDTTYSPGLLEYNTLYYWKIVAYDNNGGSTSSDVWNFTTTAGDLAGTWELLSAGIDSDGWVNALSIYENNLIAGGYFTEAGFATANNIAAWNGVSWSEMGSGASDDVNALAVNGGLLYSGGDNDAESWNGSSWATLGVVSGWEWPYFSTLTIYDNKIVGAGGVDTADGIEVNNIASWNGSSWSALGPGLNQFVYTLETYQGNLIAGGEYLLSEWNGSSWSSLGGGTSGAILAMTIYNDKLVVGGNFTSVGGVAAKNIAAWDGASWSAFGNGVGGDYEGIYSLKVYNGKLIAGGYFTSAGDLQVNNIAAWDGTSWWSLGNGIDGSVYAMEVYNSKLIVAGEFSVAGNLYNAVNIASWSETK